MRTVVMLFFSGSLLLCSGIGASAQDRWTVEVRGGVTIPTETFLDADLERGAGLEATIGYDIAPALAVYAGWDWQRFEQTEGVPFTTDVEDTGYAFGIRYSPRLSGALGPWLRVGAVYDHVELEDEAGDTIGDSQHTLGLEVGGGVTIRLGEALALTPGVRYRRFKPDVTIGQATTSTTVSYIAADVGLALKF